VINVVDVESTVGDFATAEVNFYMPGVTADKNVHLFQQNNELLNNTCQNECGMPILHMRQYRVAKSLRECFSRGDFFEGFLSILSFY
jgi:hypothetical protein